MSRINTNVEAIRAIGRLGHINNDLSIRLERLSTGLRINRGKDDPAGLIASEILRSEISGLHQAIDNSQRAINVISTAEGALNEISSLLLELRDLVVSTANEGALTNEEVQANQLEIDALLASVDRVANNTTFGGIKLIDGSRAYTLSGVDQGAIASLNVFSARIAEGSTRDVVVQVTQSAETAGIAFGGSTPAGSTTYTSAVTVEIQGNAGAELFSFASGTTLAQVRDAINDTSQLTGVSATVIDGSATATSSIVLNSTTYGLNAFVSVNPITGNFVTNGNNGTRLSDYGVDAGVIVNGRSASVDGLKADLRTVGLDAKLYLTSTFGQTLSATSFTITDGGSIFQLTSKVSPIGQLNVGIDSVSTSSLGNAVVGYLNTIGSGGVNQISKGNYVASQAIISEAVNQVATIRGRLGSLQKNSIEPTISNQQVTLENVTASESIIRDADIATEVAALTRAQILVQSTQATLGIAASAPQAVLSLLG